MRAIKKSLDQTIKHYKEISKFEEEHELKSEIETGLSSIFLISQNLPAKNISDLFSGENFSISECFEELEASYELIKYGFYKQSMISLRTGFEIGLLSIYWSILGKETEEFKEWYASKRDTPYKNRNFWETLKSNQNIEEFDKRYELISEIKSLGFLSDFVHTKGLWYSNYGRSKRAITGQDHLKNFEDWNQYFGKVIKIIEILHALKFPTLCLKFSTDFLLSKFGVFSKIPQFGAGFGDEMADVFLFIPSEQRVFIEELSKNDSEVKDVTEWINNLPDLSDDEIIENIIEEQKQNIRSEGGFVYWEKNVEIYESRVTEEIIKILRAWAQKNDLIDIIGNMSLN